MSPLALHLRIELARARRAFPDNPEWPAEQARAARHLIAGTPELYFLENEMEFETMLNGQVMTIDQISAEVSKLAEDAREIARTSKDDHAETADIGGVPVTCCAIYSRARDWIVCNWYVDGRGAFIHQRDAENEVARVAAPQPHKAIPLAAARELVDFAESLVDRFAEKADVAAAAGASRSGRLRGIEVTVRLSRVAGQTVEAWTVDGVPNLSITQAAEVLDERGS
ncbi:hypothetical protein H1O16_gp065 [Burkholderia phage BcepSaruman]|uniref:Uncharacterized protein n=1 Tax=Burkholderia phage BcepSaruman TaxID=2530032 RepID=A0A4D5ZHE2_9CAUD|nr:hypothetical protein H1O16_gp065 [Burkholderia phage BcepSaruman]QBX06478.1 hypothetical protein BcepSaruman_065 [Burkholderia phage BcepSaruman]